MIRKLLINIVSIFLLTSCGTNKSDVSSNQISKSSSIYEENTMKLEIDNIEVDVTWLDNDSVNALKMLKPLSINMHQYGDFEQTGNIGQSIIRNDKDTVILNGDIFTNADISRVYHALKTLPDAALVIPYYPVNPERAKALGDYLIVGLSTDEFNAVKGKKCYFTWEQRKLLLESLRYVDLVIPETC